MYLNLLSVTPEQQIFDSAKSADPECCEKINHVIVCIFQIMNHYSSKYSFIKKLFLRENYCSHLKM